MTQQFTCDLCDLTFNRREHHERHLRTHTKDKPFACTLCSRAFGRVDSLARHHKSTHNEVADGQTGSSEPLKRQRVSRACNRCSASKIRCDGERPCAKCTRAHAHASCVYARPKKRRHAREEDLSDAQDVAVNAGSQSPVRIIGEAASVEGICLQSPASSNMAMAATWEMDVATAPTISADSSVTATSALPQEPSLSTTFECPTDDFILSTLEQGISCDMDLRPQMVSSESNLVDWMTTSFWASPLTVQSQYASLDFIGGNKMEPDQSLVVPVPQMRSNLQSTHLPKFSVLHCRESTPELDEDAIDARQYRPTSIQYDAPLLFPDSDPTHESCAAQEDFAHVKALSALDMARLKDFVESAQTQAHYPPFLNLHLPTAIVFNAWIQLYFEYFHPLFPVLHKATFDSSDTPSLLILAVAGIGAQFSRMQNASIYARGLHELVRRLSQYFCEQYNQLGRSIWMIQAIMLNTLAMSHSGERRALEVSEILQAVPIALARRVGALEAVAVQHVPSDSETIEQRWRAWVKDEEKRRLGFGVWLVDCAFHKHYNLTNIMDSKELRNFLPQTEARWNVDNARSWSGYPLGAGQEQTLNLLQRRDYISLWQGTDTLGRQVLISLLIQKIHHQPSLIDPRDSVDEIVHKEAKMILANLLTAMDRELDEATSHELVGLSANKICSLAALMLHFAPAIDVKLVALKQIYQRLGELDLNSTLRAWQEKPREGRLAVIYAVGIFQTIRKNFITHFSMPIHLLRAILTIWLYLISHEDCYRAQLPSTFEPHTEIVLSSASTSTLEQMSREWVNSGIGKIKLPGIVNLFSREGRVKFLNESMVLMRSLSSWGISKTYLQLLKRLEASEAAGIPPIPLR